MTENQNPFGDGGFDMNALLQQAQQMQEQMMAVQIRKDSFDPADTEDLEDLIVAAYRDAKAKVEAIAAETLGPLAGGLPGMGGAEGDAGPGHQLGF